MLRIDQRQPAQTAAPVQTPSDATGRSSWEPVPLDEIVAGTFASLATALGRRTDGAKLLYAGKSHSISSEPEAGKTWLALLFAQQELDDGNAVIYLDYEDDAPGIVGRLRAMGVDVEVIRSRFIYIQPNEPLSASRRERLVELVRQMSPTLIVVDGVTEAMTSEGLSLLDNQDVAKFYRSLVTPLADCGPAVVLLDHEVKNTKAQGRWGIGAQHKLAAISGAAFKLKNTSSFAIGKIGRSDLSVVKDRHGQVRRLGRGDQTKGYIGELVIDGRSSEEVVVALEGERGRSESVDQKTQKKDAIIAFIRDSSIPVTRKQDIYDKVTGSTQSLSDALRDLIEDGSVIVTGKEIELAAHLSSS